VELSGYKIKCKKLKKFRIHIANVGWKQIIVTFKVRVGVKVTRRSIHVWKCFIYQVAQGKRGIPIRSQGIFKFADGADPINACLIFMNAIKRIIVFIGKVAGNTLSNRHRHAKHINKNEELILHHASESDQHIIFKHGGILMVYKRIREEMIKVS